MTPSFLIKECKNRSTHWAELHAVFLTVMKELNNSGKSLCLGFSWLMGSDQWHGHRLRQKDNGNLACSNDASYGAWSYENLKSASKYNKSMPIRRTPFQIQKVTGINKQISSVPSKWPHGSMKWVIWEYCSNVEMGSI